jgi:hypothetical protein
MGAESSDRIDKVLVPMDQLLQLYGSERIERLRQTPEPLRGALVDLGIEAPLLLADVLESEESVWPDRLRCVTDQR